VIPASLEIKLDQVTPLVTARDVGHTRWHSEVPPLARIAPGDIVAAETRDGGDLQVGPGEPSPEDEQFDLERLHPLTGPFFVEGAAPGDLLSVEILEVEPRSFGWSGVYPGGHGLMGDAVESTLVARWTIEDGVARSPQIPGVAIPGAPFVGTIGVAPSRERGTEFRRREESLARGEGWAMLPSPVHAIPDLDEIAAEGLRTMPPREIGGNLDLKDLSAGSRITLPVDVEGALLSVGDLHFAQGDGESYGTAIEICGRVRFRCAVEKRADGEWRPRFPVIETALGSRARDQRRYLITTGMPIEAETDRNLHLDLNVATRAALEELVAYLMVARGYSREQAQIIVSVAADLRIGVVNNPPNSVVAAALPIDIFEQSDLPASAGEGERT
jgi:formamidase